MRRPFAYEPDPKIERTFRIRRKKQRLEKRRKGQEESSKIDARAGGQRRTLWFKACHQALLGQLWR